MEKPAVPETEHHELEQATPPVAADTQHAWSERRPYCKPGMGSALLNMHYIANIYLGKGSPEFSLTNMLLYVRHLPPWEAFYSATIRG